MNILVIDGQGGKIGSMVISLIKKTMPNQEVIAIGTNSIATAAMLKAGADKGASGENPVIVNAKKAHIIVGPLGIAVANAMLGEVTPKMAEAVGDSDAQKILIPTNNCNNYVVGTESLSINELVLITVDKISKIISENK
ncbi:MAG: DUF3842 family protein [Clostridia bacterium]|nr:DUF3842 family protein [Clostridia bacterium]